MSYFSRDKPRFSEHLKGKSSKDLIDQITKEFDDDKIWFDQNPFGSLPKAGYSFDDDKFRKSGDVKTHLDDLAKRHPEFAGHLRCPPWGGESSGMNKPSTNASTDWEHAYTIPVKIEKSDDLSKATQKKAAEGSVVDSRSSPNDSGLDRHGLRNTVDIGEQVHKNVKQENETQKRAFSAPPSNGNCISNEQDDKHPKRFTSKIEITPINPYEPTTSNDGNNDGVGGSKNPSNVAGKKSNVRHIPIFVEGRRDPVYPKTGIPTAESRDQSPLKRKLDSTPTTTTTSKGQSDTEKPKPVPKKPNPLHQIEEIQKEVNDLAVKVEKYTGNSRSDKEYLYLDEMLTRNLIKLDVIEVNGNEDIRTARKNAIKSIQKCIASLESKVPTEEVPSDVEMEDKTGTDNSTSEAPMETCEENSTPETKQPAVNVQNSAGINEAETNQPASDNSSNSQYVAANQECGQGNNPSHSDVSNASDQMCINATNAPEITQSTSEKQKQDAKDNENLPESAVAVHE